MTSIGNAYGGVVHVEAGWARGFGVSGSGTVCATLAGIIESLGRVILVTWLSWMILSSIRVRWALVTEWASRHSTIYTVIGVSTRTAIVCRVSQSAARVVEEAVSTCELSTTVTVVASTQFAVTCPSHLP